MTKNLLKIMALFIFLIPPTNINNGYSPKLEKREYIETVKKREKDLETYKKKVYEVDETISSINRKREFFLMRIQEKNTSDSIMHDYIYKLEETEKKLKKYYHKRDSLYNLINETPLF
jgi:hypothetical protein